VKREDQFLRKTKFDPKMCSSPGGVPSPAHTTIQKKTGGVPSPAHTTIQKKMVTRVSLKKLALLQLKVDLGGDMCKMNDGYDSLE